MDGVIPTTEVAPVGGGGVSGCQHPAKYLRHDIMSEVRRLGYTAQLIRMIDPSFQRQLKRFGAESVLDMHFGHVNSELSPSPSNSNRPPMKLMRRQLKLDICSLNEKVQLLLHLDKDFEAILEATGTKELLDQVHAWHQDPHR